MRVRLHLVAGLGFAMVVLAPLLCAYEVALRNGTVIHFQKYRVVNNELLYISGSGEERSVLLSDVNFARTRELNEHENPPLDLQSWIDQMNKERKAPAAKPALPLGDVVREMGLKGEINTEGRVFTNDDFPSSPAGSAASRVTTPASSSENAAAPASTVTNAANSVSDWNAHKAKIAAFVEKTQGLTEQQYAARILGPDLVEVDFPRRSSWQTRLYAEHQRYVADAKLCISDRISDQGRHRDAACARLDTHKSNIQSMREEGKTAAQEWKSRQETVVP